MSCYCFCTLIYYFLCSFNNTRTPRVKNFFRILSKLITQYFALIIQEVSIKKGNN